VCLVYEVFDCGQGVHYSLMDGRCIEASQDVDTSYIYHCSCSECEILREEMREQSGIEEI